MSQGIVIKSTGSWYYIEDIKTSQIYEGRIRGKFKKNKIKTTNPLAVGDKVEYELEENSLAWITEIFPRQNYLIRKSVNLSKETHILASNIDLACIIFTYRNPQTSLGFLNRFLITCEAYQIPILIVINKIDLLNKSDMIELDNLISIYEKIGYSVIKLSAKEKINIDILKEKLQNQTSVFFGHSGSGKSSLINALNPEFKLKTNDISSSNEKGKHTTTFAQRFPWNFGGHIIDIPGIKEFELVDIDKTELQDYFPEILKKSRNCKFNNCLHVREPQCAVRKAVEQKEISEKRYQNYLKLLEEL